MFQEIFVKISTRLQQIIFTNFPTGAVLKTSIVSVVASVSAINIVERTSGDTFSQRIYTSESAVADRSRFDYFALIFP